MQQLNPKARWISLSKNITFANYIVVFIILSLGLIYFITSYQKNHMSNNQSLQEVVNTNLFIEGRPMNTIVGAVLLVNNNTVHIEGLDSWPQDYIDKEITLSGYLVFKSYTTEVENNKNGLIGDGNHYVLEQAAIEIDKGEFGYKRLTEVDGFSRGQHQEAIKAIITELENEEEDPKEYFANIDPDFEDSKLSFELIHQNSFKVEYLNYVGNPSGKDREAIYDLIQKKVTFLFYQ